MSRLVYAVIALFDFTFSDPLQQRVNGQFAGADAFEWVDEAAEHMVQPPELGRVLDGHHVADAFDHANEGAVAPFIGANLADWLVGEIVANGTMPDVSPHVLDCFGEFFSGIGFLANEVQRQP